MKMYQKAINNDSPVIEVKLKALYSLNGSKTTEISQEPRKYDLKEWREIKPNDPVVLVVIISWEK